MGCKEYIKCYKDVTLGNFYKIVNKQLIFSLFTECPPTIGGERQWFCPSSDDRGDSKCISIEQLCNSRVDCPNGEDEDETMCLFHRPVSINIFQYFDTLLHAHLKLLSDPI